MKKLTLLLFVLAACEENEEAKEPTPEQWVQVRKGFAQQFEDNMRNAGGGMSMGASVEGDDAKTLVLRMPSCSERRLKDLVSAPNVFERLNEFRFFKVRCEDNVLDYVTGPWGRR